MYQKVTIIGYLGRDPEMRYTPSGQAVTSFPVATNRSYTGSDGNRVKETTWFRVSAWGKQAESSNNYLKKGSKVLVEGRLIADNATGGPKIFTRSDGSAGSSFELSALTVQFLDSRQESENLGGGSEDSETNDEIPF
jgi:single-strand DNA-binding protein